jgi:hypothetical protein
MNREEIIRMAREAGFNPVSYTGANLELFERFAALVAAAEREACAKVAEEPYEFTSEEAHRIASAIRARGER